MQNNTDFKQLTDNFKKINIDNLPEFSPWPARLLGISEWNDRIRNEELVKNEYGQKWGKLSAEFSSNKFPSLRHTLEHLFISHFQPEILFHIEEEIYNTKNSVLLWDYFYAKIHAVLNQYLDKTDTLVELGSGWGRNLLYALDQGWCSKALGGEYTKEGQQLCNQIGKNFNLPIKSLPFDYYNPSSDFLKQLEGTVVFTHNSIEQIGIMPEETILALIASKPKAVIHAEPIYEYRDKKTMLHFMWKRYTEVNDYNKNLLTILRKLEIQGKLRITNEQVHAFGLNAFNPGSFIAWQPTD